MFKGAEDLLVALWNDLIPPLLCWILHLAWGSWMMVFPVLVMAACPVGRRVRSPPRGTPRLCCWLLLLPGYVGQVTWAAVWHWLPPTLKYENPMSETQQRSRRSHTHTLTGRFVTTHTAAELLLPPELLLILCGVDSTRCQNQSLAVSGPYSHTDDMDLITVFSAL